MMAKSLPSVAREINWVCQFPRVQPPVGILRTPETIVEACIGRDRPVVKKISMCHGLLPLDEKIGLWG
jgi:hypothetical protein